MATGEVPNIVISRESSSVETARFFHVFVCPPQDPEGGSFCCRASLPACEGLRKAPVATKPPPSRIFSDVRMQLVSWVKKKILKLYEGSTVALAKSQQSRKDRDERNEEMHLQMTAPKKKCSTSRSLKWLIERRYPRGKTGVLGGQSGGGRQAARWLGYGGTSGVPVCRRDQENSCCGGKTVLKLCVRESRLLGAGNIHSEMAFDTDSANTGMFKSGVSGWNVHWRKPLCGCMPPPHPSEGCSEGCLRGLHGAIIWP
ncbi:hypothetical protein GWK47_012410 [Chionoecetes opilio]|uniref:Uncharacterized protein n=1 Tax=Chionoecetes opilio TaxID=41210 RepID=A0A8J4XV60_CHIOP|nr:hypothetical protein GWK47_012410 [Chionoecetes opilio]